ncbi:MAG: tripartite tricarboxylate transporter substrate binding protein [Xanthobacteraceae bacterium]
MKLPRRQFLQLAAGAAALPAAPPIARAETYPSRPVRVIVGFPAGSASDVVARLTGQALSERFGQQFVIENHPGAGTNLAAEAVVRAAPDGYTLLLSTSTNAVNATLYRHLNFNFMHDIVPVASIDQTPYVMEVTLSLPPKTLPEFIAYAKANPGKINMASNGIGSGPHVAGELFKMMVGVDLVHVPYTGNVYPDLIGGQVQVMFSPIPASIGFVRAGQLRPLAVGTAKRLKILPDVPTVAEFVPGYEASGWHGIGAPANTPPDIVGKLNAEINALLANPAFSARLADLGGLQMALSPAEFGKFTAAEIDKWAKVIKFADIKSE